MSTADGTLREVLKNAYLMRRDVLRAVLDSEYRDLDRECGYPKGDISLGQYEEMYQRLGLAGRVVTCFPDECWSVDPMVFETEKPRRTAFEKRWEELVQQDTLSLYHFLHRVDCLSGIGRFGVLFLGFDDGKELMEPVTQASELLYLRAFGESCVTIAQRETQRNNPRFNLPTMYNVGFQGNGIADTFNEKVHWTRIIHVADNRQNSEIFGTPRMKPVFNHLLDVRKVLGSSAEMFYKGGFPGIAFETRPEAQLSQVEVDKESLREEFDLYQQGLQRFLALVGIEAKTLTAQVADPQGHLDALLENIAVSIKIPKRILFGSEQAHLASTHDARTWKSRVRQRQEKYVGPMLVRPFVNRLIEVGVLPRPRNYIVQWPDITAPTEEDRARIANLMAGAIAKYTQSGGMQILPIRDFLIRVLGIPEVEVDSLKLDQSKDRPMEATTKVVEQETAKSGKDRRRVGGDGEEQIE